ncbi:MAG: hypothetical protein LBB50_01335 [Oscillospiraceae bacterium]|jgi:F0F1-type ATP synthase membrane subunit b/b'|nr:hypothetical protein [Oscillospiraceae bacterium]
MSDNVDSLLTELQDYVEGRKGVGNWRFVDLPTLQDALESVRAAMPNTVERAKEIVAKRTEILDKARADADKITEDAKQKATATETSTDARVQEVVERAKERVSQMRERGEQIISDANAEAKQLIDAHTITRVAQQQADALLQQAKATAEHLEQESRRHAEQVVNEANNYSQNLLHRAEEWGIQHTTSVRTVVAEIVNEAEEILAKSLTDIHDTQKRLQATMTRPVQTSEFYAPEEPSF